jgi:LPS sulfotransferase NodH
VLVMQGSCVFSGKEEDVDLLLSDAQGEFHSAAQARCWTTALLSVRTTALLSNLLPTAWAARLIRAGRAAAGGWGRRLCARPCWV